jgi:L-fucose mutarotase/ribose pyranase (RbsD/FucU family)
VDPIHAASFSASASSARLLLSSSWASWRAWLHALGYPAIPGIHEGSKEVVQQCGSRGDTAIAMVERFKFYEKAKQAYAVVATTEPKAFGCVIIKKGVIH